MAGMPKSIVKRADEILALLEKENRQGSISGKEKEITSELKKKKGASSSSTSDGIQLNFFQLDDPVLSQIRDEIINLDINNLTPVEALNKLNEIKPDLPELTGVCSSQTRGSFRRCMNSI